MDVSVLELKARLSEYLRRVGEGEEVVITHRGPVGRTVPIEREQSTAESDRVRRSHPLFRVRPGRGGTPHHARDRLRCRLGDTMFFDILREDRGRFWTSTPPLAKRFANESGAEPVPAAEAEGEFRGCHVIGYAEGCAVPARRARELDLSPPRICELVADFSEVRHGPHTIEVHSPLVQRGGRMALEHRFRGGDRVHLAAAEAVRGRVGKAAEFRFAAFDARLAEAAGAGNAGAAVLSTAAAIPPAGSALDRHTARAGLKLSL